MAEVTDYTALLAYTSNSYYRWNSQTDLGTQSVVTYSFTSSSNLGDVAQDPYGATGYWSFNTTQRDYFRQALAEFEQAAGVRFVEIDGPAMINVFGYDGGSAAGWANYAWASQYSTGAGQLAIEGGNIAPGSYGYETVLHEIGHSLGLKHPHDGDPTLADHLDDQEHTVMTYTYGGYNVTELGTFDVQALEHIYGSAGGTSGWKVSYSYDRHVVIAGSARSETMLAAGQRSKIYAGDGDDNVLGREGNDKLYGGNGDDTVTGSYGTDRIYGGKGHDILIGGIDESTYSGQADEGDRLFASWGRDTLYGGRGDDILKAGGGADRLVGGDGSDVLTGGAHADVFVFENADYWENEIITDFGNGNDRIEFSGTVINSFSDLTITQQNGNTQISYYGNHDIELTGYTGSLSSDDFIFS
ncbi:zinc-dependent metalloprotease family protein [Leisingera sp. SS27]|uniref:reprolysin-like metallopeptidase n=1 Tax=Leisingera sp. SS27 TaxID=2979462 RepID=UPI00232E3E19|nr:zinc-dependent metalloprotease family protein [Leisingera sp. SS27]MDC0660186.1 zinc-dependent metalloprotease family protein [Leisingera sp. SS27]